MADLERIAPPAPTLPTPIGRNVARRRRPPECEQRQGSADRAGRRIVARRKPNPTT
jgi:hypothetical protein